MDSELNMAERVSTGVSPGGATGPIPPAHLSFILELFMPASDQVVGQLGDFSKNREETRRQFEDDPGPGMKTTLVGSTYDGLQMPAVFKRGAGLGPAEPGVEPVEFHTLLPNEPHTIHPMPNQPQDPVTKVMNPPKKTGGSGLNQGGTDSKSNLVGPRLSQGGLNLSGLSLDLAGKAFNFGRPLFNLGGPSFTFGKHSSSPLMLRNEADFVAGREWGDMDIFTEVTDKFVGNEDQPYNRPYSYHIHTEDTKVGYLRLTHTDPTMTGPYITNCGGIAYFSSQKMMEDSLAKAHTKLPVLLGQARVERNGPAVTIYHTHPLQREVDNVVGLPCPVWPKQVNEWVSRERLSGWPSARLLAEIVSGGCHVVPAVHRQSTWPEVEWRMSFVLCEQRLAKSLTTPQRQCYIILKTFLKYELSPPKLLSSYCLKNHLFWCMETIPAAVWAGQNALAGALVMMLDRLIHALVEGNLPHYFQPGNNMIGHLPRQPLRELAAKVIKIRQDPLRPILNFDKTYYFTHTSLYKSFEEMISPILEISKQPLSSARQIWSAQYHTLFNMCCTFTMEANYLRAYALSEAACRLAQQLDCDISPTWLLQQILLRQGNLLNAIHGFEYLMDKFPELPGTVSCSLACLYSSMYARDMNLKDNAKCAEYKKKAEDMFQKSLSTEDQAATRVDYSMFLCKMSHHTEAVDQLMDVLTVDVDAVDSYTRYGQLQRYVLDGRLREEVETGGYLEVPAVILAYYQLFQCYLELGVQDAAEDLLPEFSRICRQHIQLDKLQQLVTGQLVNILLDLMKQADTKPDTKPHSKPDTKTDTKPDSIADTISDTIPDRKPDTKSDTEPDTKHDNKPDTKPDTKTDTKPGQKQDQIMRGKDEQWEEELRLCEVNLIETTQTEDCDPNHEDAAAMNNSQTQSGDRQQQMTPSAAAEVKTHQGNENTAYAEQDSDRGQLMKSHKDEDRTGINHEQIKSQDKAPNATDNISDMESRAGRETAPGQSDRDAAKYCLLGYCYMDVGMYSAACQAFSTAATLRPGYTTAEYNLRNCLRREASLPV